MSGLRRLSVVAAVCSLVVGLLAGGANAAPTWADASTAPIHPGVQIITDGGQCTANFVFFDASSVYIGQAAHCSGTGASTEVNGCEAGVLPEGTKVDVDGATQEGTIVYNSWVHMQANNESNSEVCFGNDFALVKIDPADAGKVNPSVPFWGGPNGISATPTDVVYSYQNSSLRLGLSPLSPKIGAWLFSSENNWEHQVYTVTPGIPGDSGSGFMDSNGKAFGQLSTLQYAPLVGSNGIADLSRALSYMKAHTNSLDGVQLANGTEAFSPLI